VPKRSSGFDQVWPAIAAEQEGIVACRQLSAAGLTPDQAKGEIRGRRWRRLHDGVYATFTGPIPDRARVWAAVLRAGQQAAASHRTALWLAGVIDKCPEIVDVAIPHDRRAGSGDGVRIYRRHGLSRVVHPAARPPRVQLESAVLDVADREVQAEPAIDVLLRAIQRRLTTADRLSSHLRARPRHRWRSLLSGVLEEASEGVTTMLELRYARGG